MNDETVEQLRKERNELMARNRLMKAALEHTLLYQDRLPAWHTKMIWDVLEEAPR